MERSVRVPRSAGGLGLLLVALVGCSALTPADDAEQLLRQEMRLRGLPAESIIVPFAVDEDMVAWARQQVPNAGDSRLRLDALLSALTSPGGLALDYVSEETATATEVFASRRANCLAFTNLFVGLGRALDLPVQFLEVNDLDRYSKDGDLIVASSHVTASFADGPVRIILDFTPERDRVEYREVREITDLRAVALYYSNRGARFLRDGNAAEARKWLETAVQIDPEFPGAWVNLGVTLRRSGDPEGAQRAYRRALEADPRTSSAYLNLAAVLRLSGRDAEAAELLAITDRRDNRNPWNYLELGDLSLRHGRLDDAERYYRRALQLERESPEPLAAMGLLALERREAAEARRWLRRALDRERTALEKAAELAASAAASASPDAGAGDAVATQAPVRHDRLRRLSGALSGSAA